MTIDGTGLDGLDDAGLTELRRDKLGFIFQFFNLLPVLTAEENMLLPLTIAGRDPDREWVEQLIDVVKLGDRRTHRPAELSGGQQQRVAVARALVSKPAVVFADEPTGNLDSTASDEVLALLRRSVDEFGQTVVMVTHDPHAASFADRLVVLRDGKITEDRDALMLRLALRSLGSRKLRTFTTTLAVFLGVAFVAGTYVLTDTINKSFDDIFSEAVKGTDVAITPKEPVAQEDREPPAFPASVLREGARGRGRAAGRGRHLLAGQAGRRQGRPAGGGLRAQLRLLGAARAVRDLHLHRRAARRAPTRRRPSTPRAPSAPGLKVGGRVGVAGEREIRRYRITGLVKLGETSSGGASTAVLTGPEAQRVTGKVGKYDQISISATEGTDNDELKRRVAQVVPREVRVETGEENAERESRSIAEDLSFLKIALLVFAFVSVFVGAFLIFNTFSITVAQRIREFGMLRTLGASRRQILASVGIEAALIGAVGSLFGLVGGHRLRPGDQLAVQGDRDRPAQHRHGAGAAHGDRVAGDRAGGDAGVGAVAGAAGHAGVADGRAARGRAARVGPAGPGAGWGWRSRARSAAWGWCWSACSAASSPRARPPG